MERSLVSTLSKLNPLEIKQLRQLFVRDDPNQNNKGELYTIYIHIIECRDLKPMDSDNICEPICCINILNEKLSTRKSTKTFNPYFDQILVFKVNLTLNQLSSERIKISVFEF